MWVIMNAGAGEDAGAYWSNRHGWTDLEESDCFSETDKGVLRLPRDGQWVNIKHICFSR